MTAQTHLDDAADWLARLLSPDCKESEQLDFERWCAESEEHQKAYVAVASLHTLASDLADDPAIRNATRAAHHGARHRRQTHSFRRRGFLQAASAAVVMLAVGVGAWWLQGSWTQHQHHSTAVGEQRTLNLADGTRMHLDTETSIDVRFDRSSREVVLDSGRVEIEVAADSSRPFSVRSGRGIVRDIGTVFQVSRFGDEVGVALISGAVAVELTAPVTDGVREQMLSPGEQLHFGPQGGLGRVERVEVDSLRSWTNGTLVFKERRLDDLLAEMNRYSKTQIRVEDPALGGILVSGVFRVGDQPSLLQALKQGWSINARQNPSGDVVLSRPRKR